MKDSYTFADLQNWETAAAAAEPPIRLGVLGQPVAHSWSPQMQNAALQHCGCEMQYARFEIAPAELAPALRLLPGLGFVGVNLTVPHKVAGARLMDELEDVAARAAAVNTVRIEGEKLIGANTDGIGFARAIRAEFSVDLRDLRVLLLGAGGAGRAIAIRCAQEGCERLVLVNRSLEKVRDLAAELRPAFSDTRVAGPVPRLEAIPWETAALRAQIAHTDLIVNATSVGLQHSDGAVLPATLLAPHLMIYDTIYTRAQTPLMEAAAEAGARAANGRSMLLHQGALAFEKWFGRAAPLEVMRAALPA